MTILRYLKIVIHFRNCNKVQLLIHFELIEQRQHKWKINIFICYVMNQQIKQRFDI